MKLARVAQLARALHSHCKGPWFKSRREHLRAVRSNRTSRGFEPLRVHKCLQAAAQHWHTISII